MNQGATGLGAGGDTWVRALLAAAACVLVATAVLLWAPWDDPAIDVAPRASLAAYDWDELARIGEGLSRCASAERAYAVAARFGLCDATGAPDASDTKDLVLADGSVVRVCVAGVWQDARSAGGRAGLTLAMLDVAGTHPMNHAFEDAEGEHADSVGGWAASDMRAWLDGTLFFQLPLDLRAHVVRVQKRTASHVDVTDELYEPGHLAGAATDWVEETSDLLWLFSAAELCGSVPARDDLGVDDTMAAVYGAEGSQYPLFAQEGVTAFVPQPSLVRTGPDGASCTWWLRTKTLEFAEGFWLVGTDGTPLNGLGEDARVAQDREYAPDELWGPDHARGVVVGFCL